MHSPIFNRESTLDLIDISEDIPTLPDRFVRIQSIVDDPNASLQQLVDVIHTDQATCAMVLKIANSAARNPTGRPISNLFQAIALLGTKEVSHIAMGMSLMYGFALPMGITHVRAFWVHAFSTGLTCEFLAKQLVGFGNTNIDTKEAFMAGLLHDIGRAVLGLRVDLSYFESPLMLLDSEELMEAERQNYGIDHAEAGEYALKAWNFPPSLVHAAANHHRADNNQGLSAIVYAACQLARKYCRNGMQIEEVPDFLHETLFAAITPEIISGLS